MPNRSSHAHHQPQRTCVVCRTRGDAAALLGFIVLREGVVFDPGRKLQRRRLYLCPAPACYQGFDKWRKRWLRRNFGITDAPPVFSVGMHKGSGHASS